MNELITNQGLESDISLSIGGLQKRAENENDPNEVCFHDAGSSMSKNSLPSQTMKSVGTNKFRGNLFASFLRIVFREGLKKNCRVILSTFGSDPSP